MKLTFYIILFLSSQLNVFAQIQEKMVVENKGGLYHLSYPIYPERYFAPKKEILISKKLVTHFEASQLEDIYTTIQSYFSCSSVEWLKKISVKQDYAADFGQTSFAYKKAIAASDQLFKLYISSQFFFTYRNESYCINMVHTTVYNSMLLCPVILVKKNNVWLASDNVDLLLFSAYLRIKPEHWASLLQKGEKLPIYKLENIDYSTSRFLVSYGYYYENIVFDTDSTDKLSTIPIGELNINESTIDIKFPFQLSDFELINKVGYHMSLNSYVKGSNDIDQFFSNLTKPHSDTTAEQAMAYWLFSKDTLYQRKNSIGYEYMKKEFVHYINVSGISNRLSLKYNIALYLDGSNYKIIYFDEWHGIKENVQSYKEHWVGIKSIVLKKVGESWLVCLDKQADIFKVLRGFDVFNEEGIQFCLTAKLSGNEKYDYLLNGFFMAQPDGRIYIENTIFLWKDWIFNYEIPSNLKNGFGVVAPYDLYEEKTPKYWQDR